VSAEKFNIPKYIQEGRRVVDFPQAGGVLGFVPGEELAAGCLSCG